MGKRSRNQTADNPSNVSFQTLSAKPAAREDLEEELVEQELFVHDPLTGEIHCLNSGAAIIWLLCDGTRDAGDIAREIAAEYGFPEQDILAEVQEMLSRLQVLGLFTTSSHRSYEETRNGIQTRTIQIPGASHHAQAGD